ncbi:di- and tricarboxylate transporter [Haloferula helveola]|uniref:Di- and tricarboxylate transporter n=1 Tax=Haloferula helveola TaxID=490095 RepID=A0ABN6H0L1_9BACT|nr:di- and tricarboxylate transporter [Haloferula helveola]
MSLDTRAQSFRLLGHFDRGELASILKTLGCAALAAAVVWGPGWLGSDLYADLSPGGQAALGIMVFAAGLWVTEAMPAFAVALLVIGLQIAILGNPGGVWAPADSKDAWTLFVKPWSSPTMWLFFGGFVLAHACSKTQLDRWMAGHLLGRFVGRPPLLVLGVMAVTFVFSMFMSNTATAAMMVAVTAPVIAGLPEGSRLGRGVVIAVALAANLGGIGTIIGTPPNAIAAGQLADGQKIDFMRWMMIALPPALVLAALGYGVVWWRWIRGEKGIEGSLDSAIEGDDRQFRHRLIVMLVFAITVGLWMSESVLGIPSPVVSFVPIVVFAVTGVIGATDMRQLPWDVLLLLAGGLSLGVGVKETGLAAWLADQVPNTLPPLAIAAVFCFVGLVLSNLMSNTAAAALLVPLGASLVAAEDSRIVILSVAIGCSAAMALPISTPPNAIAYGSGRISSRDFLVPGLVVGLLTPLVVLWLKWTVG